MKIELRWLASLSTSCLHAAEAMAHGKTLTNDQLAAAIAEPAKSFAIEIAAAGLPEQCWWQNLIALSAGIESNRQLIELALRKTIGSSARSDLLLERLTPLLTDLEQSVLSAAPKLLDELALRGGPLRQQWEAHGPGLLRNIAQQSDPRLIVPRADVILVQPALGGTATPHLPYNSVRIEAVLASPVAELPETVRLGWALSQLNLDMPIFSETINAGRLPLVAGLAMLPITLNAAEPLELARYNAPTLKMALSAWRLEAPDAVDLNEVVTQWWETYCEARPDFGVALSALDHMLGDF